MLGALTLLVRLVCATLLLGAVVGLVALAVDTLIRALAADRPQRKGDPGE